MNAAQKTRYKDRLLSSRQDSLTALGVKFDLAAHQGRVAEEDQAVLSHDEFVSTRMNRLEWLNLRRINAALERLEGGEYGICEECGEAISPRRLDAIPWASLCVSCQERRGEDRVDDEDPILLESLVRRN